MHYLSLHLNLNEWCEHAGMKKYWSELQHPGTDWWDHLGSLYLQPLGHAVFVRSTTLSLWSCLAMMWWHCLRKTTSVPSLSVALMALQIGPRISMRCLEEVGQFQSKWRFVLCEFNPSRGDIDEDEGVAEAAISSFDYTYWWRLENPWSFAKHPSSWCAPDQVPCTGGDIHMYTLQYSHLRSRTQEDKSELARMRPVSCAWRQLNSWNGNDSNNCNSCIMCAYCCDLLCPSCWYGAGSSVRVRSHTFVSPTNSPYSGLFRFRFNSPCQCLMLDVPLRLPNIVLHVGGGSKPMADMGETNRYFDPWSSAMLAASGVAGFFEVFLQFLLNEAWTDEFEPYLENNCSGGIYTVGHSQGMGTVFGPGSICGTLYELRMISSICDPHHDWFDILWIVCKHLPTSWRSRRWVHSLPYFGCLESLNSLFTRGQPMSSSGQIVKYETGMA